ncbi:hypothetical protein GQ457_13G019240 [Hibiscus cannabinus]
MANIGTQMQKSSFKEFQKLFSGSWYRYSEASTDTQVPMGNLGTDTPPLVPIPGELTRGYRYPYSGIDTWCITRGTDTLPSMYRYPNSSVGFGYRYH